MMNMPAELGQTSKKGPPLLCQLVLPKPHLKKEKKTGPYLTLKLIPVITLPALTNAAMQRNVQYMCDFSYALTCAAWPCSSYDTCHTPWECWHTSLLQCSTPQRHLHASHPTTAPAATVQQSSLEQYLAHYVQYSTVQCSTWQCSTIQHSLMQYLA